MKNKKIKTLEQIWRKGNKPDEREIYENNKISKLMLSAITIGTILIILTFSICDVINKIEILNLLYIITLYYCLISTIGLAITLKKGVLSSATFPIIMIFITLLLAIISNTISNTISEIIFNILNINILENEMLALISPIFLIIIYMLLMHILDKNIAKISYKSHDL